MRGFTCGSSQDRLAQLLRAEDGSSFRQARGGESGGSSSARLLAKGCPISLELLPAWWVAVRLQTERKGEGRRQGINKDVAA